MKTLFEIHFLEFKYRGIYLFFSYISSFIICFIYKLELLFLISKSFLLLNFGFIYTKLTDPLFMYLKIIVIFAFFSILFNFYYLIFYFFCKSIFNYKIKIFIIFFIFFYSFTFFYYYIFLYSLPFIFSFFTLFERLDLNFLLIISLEAKLDEYVDFFWFLIFLIFFISHFPLYFLFYILNFQFTDMIILRKYFYLFISLIFLIVMPPDFLFQFLFFPIIIFFIELCFLFFYWIINFVNIKE